jgi:hypothetical protein
VVLCTPRVHGSRWSKHPVPGAGNSDQLAATQMSYPSGFLLALGPWMARGAHTQIHRDDTEVFVGLYDVMTRGAVTTVCLTLCLRTQIQVQIQFHAKGFIYQTSRLLGRGTAEMAFLAQIEPPRRHFRMHKMSFQTDHSAST